MASYDQSCRCGFCGALLELCFSEEVGFLTYCLECDIWSGLCENCLQITDMADMDYNLCIDCAIMIREITQQEELEILHQKKES